MKRRKNGSRPRLRDRREGQLSRYCRDSKTPYNYGPMFARLARQHLTNSLVLHRKARNMRDDAS